MLEDLHEEIEVAVLGSHHDAPVVVVDADRPYAGISSSSQLLEMAAGERLLFERAEELVHFSAN